MRPFTTAGARIGVLLGLLASASAVPGAATAAPMAETVLVKVAPGADAGDRAAISRRLGAESVRALPAGWRAYRVGEDITRAQAARVVAGLPAEAVELDQRVELAAIPDDPFFPYQRHLAQIGAPRAWDLAAAAGTPAVPVTVAVIDSGLDTGHPDIAGRLWVNAAERDGMPNRDDDDNGIVDDIHGANLVDVPYNGDVAAARSTSTSHGTHVAGLIGAATGNGTGIAGVAPTSRILTVRFLSGGSGGGLAKAIQGIEYARRAGARVINMSWTLTPGATSQALCDAVAEAGRDGIVMVAAAGNDGQDLDRTPAQPASCPSPAVIAVAATDGADDELSAFSNTGAATVDLAAPGTEPPTFIGDDTTPGLLSLYPSSPGRALYVRTRGTSMAAPLVAGAAALMLGARPGLTPEHVGALLRSTGVPRPGLAATTLSGRRLDLGAAVAASIEAVLTDAVVEVVPLRPDARPQATARPRFSWSAGTPDPIEYQVLVDGRAVAAVPGSARDATPAVAIADGMHTWHVRGTGAPAGPERPLVIDTTPPDRLGVAATATPAALLLAWSRPADATSGVAGVRVERGGAIAAELGPDSTGHTLPPVAPGATESIAVTATDRAGNASRTEIAVTGTASAPPPAATAAPPPPTVARRTRVIRVAATAHPRRYEVRAHRGRTRQVIARGRLGPRARTITVRLPRSVTATTRLSVRTSRMHTTSRRRTVRVGSARHVRRYTVRAHDVSRRWVVARGRLAPRQVTIRVRLRPAVAAVGPRLTVTIRDTP